MLQPRRLKGRWLLNIINVVAGVESCNTKRTLGNKKEIWMKYRP